MPEGGDGDEDSRKEGNMMDKKEDMDSWDEWYKSLSEGDKDTSMDRGANAAAATIVAAIAMGILVMTIIAAWVIVHWY